LIRTETSWVDDLPENTAAPVAEIVTDLVAQTIAPGGNHAFIVGPTGSGKSVFLSFLALQLPWSLAGMHSDAGHNRSASRQSEFGS
jgi:ABC-type molybdenum transport system ATPase subunit/photorepair protein PhrA